MSDTWGLAALVLSGSQDTSWVSSEQTEGHMDRASWPPTFHIEGLELDQVPNGTWEMGQLIPFHVQDLRKRENGMRRHTHRQNNAYPTSGQASSRHHTYIFISRKPCEEDTNCHDPV